MDLQPIHHPPTTFVKKYLISTDHKVIAKQFLWVGLIFLAFGGLLAILIRWQLTFPGEPVPGLVGKLMFAHNDGVIGPAEYATLFTNHGLIMIFFAITPILIGCFGNFCIPLLIGARDMAFPWLNALSFWTFIISCSLVVISFFQELGAASAGWTTYAPLSTQVGTPGSGQSMMVVAIFVSGTATIMGAINYVATVIRLRAPGMTYMKMPLTIWGFWLTSILNLLFVPVLAAGAILLQMDRSFGTEFFIANAVGFEGDPILFQHLFWIFGHPEVYILILPAWGIMGDIVAHFSRKPAYWYRGSVYAMVAVSILSCVVYGHHMFNTGMNPLLGQSFMLLTLVISVPAEVLFLNWLHTMWHGSIRLTVPMLFALGTIFVFAIGGLTGIYLGTISTDIYLHDTYFVVGHFHFTMAAASFLASFSAIYFWFPKMFGRMMDTRLGKYHFWGSVIFITLVFGGQMLTGYAGMQRRLYDASQYTFLTHLDDMSKFTTYSAFILTFFQLFFVFNFFKSIWAGQKAPANPWEIGTLEWTIPSPAPVHNFTVIPTVIHGPHEYANPEVLEKLGKDWIAQDEVIPGNEPVEAEVPEEVDAGGEDEALVAEAEPA
jgi:cytochrome c oxidase subunit 1